MTMYMHLLITTKSGEQYFTTHTEEPIGPNGFDLSSKGTFYEAGISNDEFISRYKKILVKKLLHIILINLNSKKVI